MRIGIAQTPAMEARVLRLCIDCEPYPFLNSVRCMPYIKGTGRYQAEGLFYVIECTCESDPSSGRNGRFFFLKMISRAKKYSHGLPTALILFFSFFLPSLHPSALALEGVRAGNCWTDYDGTNYCGSSGGSSSGSSYDSSSYGSYYGSSYDTMMVEAAGMFGSFVGTVFTAMAQQAEIQRQVEEQQRVQAEINRQEQERLLAIKKEEQIGLRADYQDRMTASSASIQEGLSRVRKLLGLAESGPDWDGVNTKDANPEATEGLEWMREDFVDSNIVDLRDKTDLTIYPGYVTGDVKDKKTDVLPVIDPADFKGNTPPILPETIESLKKEREMKENFLRVSRLRSEELAAESRMNEIREQAKEDLKQKSRWVGLDEQAKDEWYAEIEKNTEAFLQARPEYRKVFEEADQDMRAAEAQYEDMKKRNIPMDVDLSLFLDENNGRLRWPGPTNPNLPEPSALDEEREKNRAVLQIYDNIRAQREILKNDPLMIAMEEMERNGDLPIQRPASVRPSSPEAMLPASASDDLVNVMTGSNPAPQDLANSLKMLDPDPQDVVDFFTGRHPGAPAEGAPESEEELLKRAHSLPESARSELFFGLEGDNEKKNPN